VATPRLACVVVPLFSLAARLRSEPELVREAVVVVEGNGSAARVVAASRLARRAGVRPGLTLTQARALIPKLVARARDAECERAAQEALLEIADRFSPRVEDAGEGVAYLDVEGIDRRFAGEPSPELSLGRALLAAAEGASLPAKAGIASSKLAARVAAALPESPSIVAAGQEADFLAPLPLARLSPLLAVGDLASTFARWGIRTIGELARLPGSRLASRMGSAGRDLHATARGVDPRPLAPRQPPAAFHEGLDLEWPLVALEPFLFVGRAALERLTRRLEANGLACARLELTLRLEPDGHQLRSIDLPAPTRDVKTLLTLLRLDLEARPPGAPLAGFSLAAHADRPREAQLSMYGPAALSPDKLAATIARLFALLGPGRIGSPRPVDGHLPERAALVEYAPPPPPSLARDPRRITGRGLLAVRVLRPPVEIEVISEEPPETGKRADSPRRHPARGDAAPEPAETDEREDSGSPQRLPARERRETKERADSPERHQGPERPEVAELPAMGEPSLLPPLEVLAVTRETTAGRPRIAGRVKVAAGPWGMEDEWWMPDPTGRDYWDVELTTGGLYRIYRDRASGSWYADGIYD
jgi:protein ImuB